MILITGATGNVGREVVNLLRASGEKVVAVTRHPATAALPDSAVVVEGDPTRPQTLAKALRGVEAVFISPRALGDATAGAATVELLKLAAEQGVQRVVVLSAVTVEYGVGYQHFADAFKAVEDAARASGLQWTILRCSDFASNALAWAPQIRAAGVVRGVYGDAATLTIHERDIAAVSALALVDAAHTARTYVLTGPQSLTQREKARLIGEAIGPRCPGWRWPLSSFARPCSLRVCPRMSLTGSSAIGPTTSGGRNRLHLLWSGFWAAPRSPSPNGQLSTPPPFGTERTLWRTTSSAPDRRMQGRPPLTDSHLRSFYYRHKAVPLPIPLW